MHLSSQAFKSDGIALLICITFESQLLYLNERIN